MDFQPVLAAQNTSNELVRVLQGDDTYLLKRYRGKMAQSHRDTERARLTQWRRAGYPVSRVIEFDVPGESGPYLVLEWFEGRSLSEFLQDVEVDRRTKLDRWVRILADIHARQTRVLRDGEADFIHHDSNTGNVLVAGAERRYIDFEERVVPRSASIAETLAVELARFLRWTVRDLGRAHLESVIQQALTIYGSDSQIVSLLVERIYRPPLQFVHRWKDRRRRRQNPLEITKYDLADAISTVLK